MILDFENWHQNLKNAVFWQPSIKRFYKISKNPLRMFIWMQKSIEFHLPHYEIPQLSSYYCTYFSTCTAGTTISMCFLFLFLILVARRKREGHVGPFLYRDMLNKKDCRLVRDWLSQFLWLDSFIESICWERFFSVFASWQDDP